VEPAAIEGRDRVILVLPAPVWMDVGEATRSLEAARAAARRGLWEGVREHSVADEQSSSPERTRQFPRPNEAG
jgi:hypothetical protein